MEKLSSGGVDIAYSVHGTDRPVLCLHGFCGTSGDNYVRTGWITPLTRLERQVILMDTRGHGESGKLYEPKDYEGPRLIDDVIRLLDHLKIDKVELIGFSMGGVITLGLCVHRPERVRAAVVMGVGDMFYGAHSRRDDNADALDAADPATIQSERARAFRRYAESLGQDLKALSAVARAPRPIPAKEEIATIRIPMFFIVGARDGTAGGLTAFEEALPRAKTLIVPGVDHVSTLSHGLIKGEVIEFLEGL